LVKKKQEKAQKTERKAFNDEDKSDNERRYEPVAAPFMTKAAKMPPVYCYFLQSGRHLCRLRHQYQKS